MIKGSSLTKKMFYFLQKNKLMDGFGTNNDYFKYNNFYCDTVLSVACEISNV